MDSKRNKQDNRTVKKIQSETSVSLNINIPFYKIYVQCELDWIFLQKINELTSLADSSIIFIKLCQIKSRKTKKTILTQDSGY